MYDKKLEDKLAQERESQKKELDEKYNNKLEDALAHEQEMCTKELEDLYAV